MTSYTFIGTLRTGEHFFFNEDAWKLLHLDNISRENNISFYKKTGLLFC